MRSRSARAVRAALEAGRAAHDHGTLSVQLTRAHQPVERVLEHAGQAVRVLGCREEDTVARTHELTQRSNCIRRRIDLGIEGSDLGEVVVDDHLEPRGRAHARHVEQGTIRGARLQASGDAKNPHVLPNPRGVRILPAQYPIPDIAAGLVVVVVANDTSFSSVPSGRTTNHLPSVPWPFTSPGALSPENV